MSKYFLAFLTVFSTFSVSYAGIFQDNPDQDIYASSVQHWNDSNFDTIISKGIVVVDFYSDSCAPCHKFSPIFEKIAGILKEKALFGKVNVDRGRNAANTHNVRSIPTVVVFKNGKEIKRRTGFMDTNTFRDWLNTAF